VRVDRPLSFQVRLPDRRPRAQRSSQNR
jgi:hypothetical protein